MSIQNDYEGTDLKRGEKFNWGEPKITKGGGGDESGRGGRRAKNQREGVGFGVSQFLFKGKPEWKRKCSRFFWLHRS